MSLPVVSQRVPPWFKRASARCTDPAVDMHLTCERLTRGVEQDD
jgi:hypothetical protein